ncbi:hypothetical protein [Hahella ganghwensis]|uniref:hypothetical protein n=1 Tax=Hahella ganghwensis TaxID=286420 RepID=UPI0003611562|nr:hypothetical protein [Hahella ganghwensis]
MASEMANRVVGKVKEIEKIWKSGSILIPEEYGKQLDNLLRTTLKHGAAYNKETPEERYRTLMGQYTDLVDGLNKKYQKLYSKHSEYLKEERLVAKLDLRERLRYLVFRMLTGVGIAAIVLATGWIAKEFEIPLPLLRAPV